MTEALQKGQKRYSLCFKTKHIPNFNLSGFIVQKNILNRPVNFLGFSGFAQNQNFSQKFWAKTQNLPKLQMYEFLT